MFNNPSHANAPIVEGQILPSTYNSTYVDPVKPTHNSYTASENPLESKQQPPQYNDTVFAIGFLLHLAFMLVLFVSGVSTNPMQNYTSNFGLITLVGICSVTSIAITSTLIGYMIRNTEKLIETSLYTTVVLYVGVGIVGMVMNQLMMGLVGFGLAALSGLYAWCVRSRIPFASSNLKAALLSVEANRGLFLTSSVLLGLAIVWSCGWTVLFQNFLSSSGTGVIFLLLVSLYWTQQVLTNTLHVVTSGVIGSWWFDPPTSELTQEKKLISHELVSSTKRATTYAFGSICFGSLLVAIIQATRSLHQLTREDDNFNFLNCLLQCILSCLEDMMEYFNTWAYVYVGLYGFPYLEAGKNVLQLFENKGWSVIITDNLCENCLFIVSIGIGMVSGVMGVVMASMNPSSVAAFGVEVATSGFLVGLVVGVVLSSILLSVVNSAVNTVIVCFAEAPQELDRNHGAIGAEMREGWRKSWPELMM